MFMLINLDTNEAVTDEATGTLRLLADGKAASLEAKAMTEATGIKHQPRPYVESSAWKEREAARFADGTYKRVPLPDWLEALLIAEHPAHFVHFARDHADCVAFTKDANMGAQDRQTRMTATAYMDRYYPTWRVYRDMFLQAVAECNPVTVKFATTPDEIEEVYTNYDHASLAVANSCMRHKASAFKGGQHPARVYGAGDLAIAYIANARGETTDRALCWPEKKVYGRVYGVTDRLHTALKGMGYVKSETYYSGEVGATGSFIGAKLLRIEAEDCTDDVYVMPYIDDDVGVLRRGKFFEICEEDSDYSVRETNGTTSDSPENTGTRALCENCEEDFDEDEAFGVAAAASSAGRGRNTQIWCPCCVESDAYLCDATSTYFSEDSVPSVEMADGEIWNRAYFVANGFTSELTDECYSDSKACTVIVGEASYQTWAHTELDEENSFEFEGGTYSRNAVELVPVITDIDLFGAVTVVEMPSWIADERAFVSDIDGRMYADGLQHICAPEMAFHQMIPAFAIAAE